MGVSSTVATVAVGIDDTMTPFWFTTLHTGKRGTPVGYIRKSSCCCSTTYRVSTGGVVTGVYGGG